MAARDRLYEHLLTTALENLLRPEGEQLQTQLLALTESPTRLARHLAQEVERALDSVGGDKSERVQRQAEIIHSLLDHLRGLAPPWAPSW